MSESSLKSRLQQYAQEAAENNRRLDDALAALDGRISEVQDDIRRLHQEVARLEAERRERMRERALLDERRYEGLGALAQEALEESREALQAAAARVDAIKRLEQQRDAMLGADPELAERYVEYVAYEASGGAEAQRFSPSYRRALEECHRLLRERLTPYLDILKRLEDASRPQEMRVQIVFAHDAPDDEMHWILPLAPETRPDDPESLAQVSQPFMARLTQINAQPEWYFAEILLDPWGAFLAVSALAEYRGEKAPAAWCEEWFTQGLAEAGLFEGVHWVVEVAPAPLAVWPMGKPVLPAPSVEQAYVEPPLAEADLRDAPPIAPNLDVVRPKFLGNNWFTPEDIAAWERPHRTSETSQWTTQGRRLRTMVMRLLAQGIVGESALAPDALWQGMPPEHAMALQRGIEKLAEEGLIVQRQGDGALSLSLSLEHADLIEELINRDVSPRLEPLINDPPTSAARAGA